MQIEPLSRADLDLAARHIAAALDGPARAAWRRIVEEAGRQLGQPMDTPIHREVARDVAMRLGIRLIDAAPAEAFSWDGAAIRSRSEASVLLHEVAHWQLCPAARLVLPDFGLGAGPETGRKAEADAARAVDPLTEVKEEQHASLLGILWEAQLGLPALGALLEQNWLEGWRRGAAVAHFRQILGELMQLGLVAADGTPQLRSVRT
jgi:hypothetical protein